MRCACIAVKCTSSAALAQSGELLVEDREVVGSIPTRGISTFVLSPAARCVHHGQARVAQLPSLFKMYPIEQRQPRLGFVSEEKVSTPPPQQCPSRESVSRRWNRQPKRRTRQR